MSPIRVLLSLMLLPVLAAWAWADDWLAPTPRIFAAAWGDHGLKIVPKGFADPALATLFRLDGAGAEKVIWREKLVNMPHRALIAGNGKRVVTVDTWASVGYKHCLVVYDEKGQVLADYQLEDLLTNEEIARNVRTTVGSRWWSTDADFAFSPSDERLVIKLKWGKTITIDLTKGKIEK